MNNELIILKAASFAARKHAHQIRKGANSEPYINHPLEVAKFLADIGMVTDIDRLIAAILHDTIEDTATTKDEIKLLFGVRVAMIVEEVTDDKSLPKDERKRLQVEHAPHLSLEAKQLKMADKISNIRDVIDNPPTHWSDERRKEYVAWGENVMKGLRGANDSLEKYFDSLVSSAEAAFDQE